MTTEITDQRRRARAREESAPVLTEASILQMEQQQMAPQNPPQEPAAGPMEAAITVKNAGYVTLYKKVDYGWKPTVVTRDSAAACLATGSFMTECGDCHGHCGLDPNSCPGRQSLPFRRCPVCAKRIFDTVEDADSYGAGELEEGEIRDEAYRASTPAERTKVKLDNHIVAFHPSDAQRMGLIGTQIHSGAERQVVVAPAPARAGG